MDLQTVLYFIAGIVLLVLGAEILVRGASHLAVACGISPLVVGLTVVAFGTSAPELAVTIKAVLAGGDVADIAVGNVLGSNVANQLLILGLAALVAPLVVHAAVVRREVPILICVAFLAFGLAWDGTVSRLDGIILFILAVGYTAFAVIAGRREVSDAAAAQLAEGLPGDATEPARSPLRLLRDLAYIVVGLVLLVWGSNWLVNSAVSIAEFFNVDELIIGLTVVAVGTSLPEIATSILATLKGERDIAVGNVVGSSIFNLTTVLGLGAALAPAGIAVQGPALEFDFPVMLVATVALLPIFFTGFRIARWEGILFLLYYAAYTIYLLLNTTRSEALEPFTRVMLWFVIPLTVVTVAVTCVRQWQKHGLQVPAEG